jgi:hypothetical protein
MGHESTPPARASYLPGFLASWNWRLRTLALVLISYVVLTYGLIPLGWRRYASAHPAMELLPQVTHTKDGIPGDPVNMALVGTTDQIIQALLAAGWHPADAITLRSSLKISEASVLHRPYEDAPVSNLYLWGRRQDLAYEQPVGHDPRQRHHMRLWCCEGVEEKGQPLWIGAATMDRSVGFSHTTGQVTHHIDAAVDAERDKLVADLERTGRIASVDWLPDFHSQRRGRNGGGDPYYTDGFLPIVEIAGPKPD